MVCNGHKTIRRLVWALSVFALGWLPLAGLVSAQAQEKVYYRYVNDEGVQVLDDHIPPRFVPKGYEVVSLNGTVLRRVAPAPSPEEQRARKEAKRQRIEQDAYHQELRRRYSTVKDIEDAKRRNLAELQGNISILESNLSNVRLQIRDQEGRAARLERSGQTVPDALLDNIATLKQEVQKNLAQIERRQTEYDEVAEKFDEDAEAFRAMKASSQSAP